MTFTNKSKKRSGPKKSEKKSQKQCDNEKRSRKQNLVKQKLIDERKKRRVQKTSYPVD